MPPPAQNEGWWQSVVREVLETVSVKSCANALPKLSRAEERAEKRRGAQTPQNEIPLRPRGQSAPPRRAPGRRPTPQAKPTRCPRGQSVPQAIPRGAREVPAAPKRSPGAPHGARTTPDTHTPHTPPAVPLRSAGRGRGAAGGWRPVGWDWFPERPLEWAAPVWRNGIPSRAGGRRRGR